MPRNGSTEFRRGFRPGSGAIGILAAALLATLAGAQAVPITPGAGTFVDLSTTGGTALVGLSDDATWNITTTVGNPLFPAGPVLVGMNGLISGGGGPAPSLNADIPSYNTIPASLAGGVNGILAPYWDDLTWNSDTQLYWQESAGVLTIMFKHVYHYDTASTFGLHIDFEVKVFGSPAPGTPWIQYLYPDATFGGVMAANDHGASATVGYYRPNNTTFTNAKWSWNTPSVPDGLVLNINAPMTLTASSPSGPGSLRLDIASGPGAGTYVLGVTLSQGQFPVGWLYGVDVPLSELSAEVAGGYPFTGALGASGALTIGPFGGVPPITFYAVALGFLSSGVPIVHTQAVAYTVP